MMNPPKTTTLTRGDFVIAIGYVDVKEMKDYLNERQGVCRFTEAADVLTQMVINTKMKSFEDHTPQNTLSRS